MIEAIVIGVLGAGVPVAYWRGLVQSKVKMPKHEHLWDHWEKELINIVNPSGKFLYKKAVQSRKCITCGFIEQEYL